MTMKTLMNVIDKADGKMKLLILPTPVGAKLQIWAKDAGERRRRREWTERMIANHRHDAQKFNRKLRSIRAINRHQA